MTDKRYTLEVVIDSDFEDQDMEDQFYKLLEHNEDGRDAFGRELVQHGLLLLAQDAARSIIATKAWQKHPSNEPEHVKARQDIRKEGEKSVNALRVMIPYRGE